MKCSCAALMVLLLSGSAFGADTRSSLPAWVLGKWAVTKVYEFDGTYPEPGTDPREWLGDQTMSIESNRLSLRGEVCADLDVVRKRGPVAQILAAKSNQKPSEIGLKPRKDGVDYLAIRCRHGFTAETSERIGIDYIKWYLVMDERDQSEIELAFWPGVYLELHRPQPPS